MDELLELQDDIILMFDKNDMLTFAQIQQKVIDLKYEVTKDQLNAVLRYITNAQGYLRFQDVPPEDNPLNEFHRRKEWRTRFNEVIKERKDRLDLKKSIITKDLFWVLFAISVIGSLCTIAIAIAKVFEILQEPPLP